MSRLRITVGASRGIGNREWALVGWAGASAIDLTSIALYPAHPTTHISKDRRDLPFDSAQDTGRPEL